MNVFECALSDQFNNDAADVLWLHNTYGGPEEMPVDVFFRDPEDMPEMELYALSLCKGKILDVGAGVGSHALVLQKAGLDVTALDISKTACDISKLRGLSQVINLDIFSHDSQKYDTILMLMNGIGLAGRLERLPALLEHCQLLLNKGGQILFDSSDISYLYDDVPFPDNKYFGELSYKYQYKGISGDWFNWLYVDKQTLEIYAAESGFKFQLLMEDDMDQYLGRLSV
ncbi:class I SAM-dependent methyltransferase [Paradesertivirga mongoliensis]|uniref:Class I SAM-dependent methyltransferase n=1 Tax=Paradesertivirga mongoliensis TaxID=2100740 RepID=A0ABW4ZPP3_9SPHI|nr:methyltransferase domain-containing protein [Pedobacter mongoliensis]